MRRPPKTIAVLMATIHAKNPHDLSMMFKEALDHMVKGHDTFEEGSAGGWSQGELDRYVAIVSPFIPAKAMADTLARLRGEDPAERDVLKAS